MILLYYYYYLIIRVILEPEKKKSEAAAQNHYGFIIIRFHKSKEKILVKEVSFSNSKGIQRRRCIFNNFQWIITY